MRYDLSLLHWKVAGVWPNVPFLYNSIETGAGFRCVTPWVDAIVPGSIYKDLLNAGIIEDPYFEMNSLKCEWVANRWWLYKCALSPYEIPDGGRARLIFKGIDYKAHFYINGMKLGEHEGMFRPAVFDITKYMRKNESLELTVIIENAPEDLSQINYTSKLKTQKSRFDYKWDFSTRMVNVGIYDEVYLDITGPASIEDIWVRPEIDLGAVGDSVANPAANHGRFRLNIKVQAEFGFSASIMIDVADEHGGKAGKRLEHLLHKGGNEIECFIEAENPLLWYPNGKGPQNLYNIKASILNGSSVSDERTIKSGFRKLSFARNENAPEDSLPYTVLVNGDKVYIKGVNLVPLDQMYGCVGRERYEKAVMLLKDANVNLVRVWGGGIIEKEYFYELCDRYGILVWQDFIQSSSGIDNIPCEDEEYLKLLRKTAEYAVREKRNHVCLAIWCGGNELTDGDGIPITCAVKNIRELEAVVRELDPERAFLPSTPSGPVYILDTALKGSNHDVHGPWKYGGTEGHYNLFNLSTSLFHSEFGVDGMSCVESLARFLAKDNLNITDMNENITWRHHGDWWDTKERDERIFGESGSLEDLVKNSQFVQAEGIRYAVEANRRRMFHNSGSIIWQFNEPWPNVSCTCLVDYYLTPKLAYEYVRKAYRPVHVSLKYERLVYKKGDMFRGEIFAHNDLAGFEGEVLCRIIASEGEAVYSKRMLIFAKPNASFFVTDACWQVDGSEGSFTVELELHGRDAPVDNGYMFIIKG